ncbi:protein SMG5 [Tetranychus urticae]|uniref:PIN domain-containing protein n=1 Tax=Tetranychus urticae TaxID=32264 RepID=T1K899_TETUR|nr:protein SMG5 [Tetranychus urticae]
METRSLMQATFNKLPNKLKEQCENCLLKDVVGHGKKAEEILWTRVYHEPMQIYKRMKGAASSQDIIALQLHFVSGVGFYYSLLQKISAEYKIDFGPALSELKRNLIYCEPLKVESQRNVTNQEREAIRLVTHGIYIHLGDIFRYLDYLNYPESKSMAIKWYDIAILFEPSIGMPYNQLGTLCSNYNYGFDSAYFYMRCLMSDKPFDGAEGNLKRILMSAPRFLAEEMNKNRDTDEEIVKKCIIQLLIVANHIFNDSSSKSEMEVANAIQEFLTTFTLALNLSPKARTPHKPTYLDPALIFEMGTMSLMFINYLRANGIGSGIYYSASVALALNFLLLNVNAFLVRFKDKIDALNVSQKPTAISNGSGSGAPSSSKENSPEFSPRRTLSRLRRRKAAITYENIDTYLLDFDEDDSELSELEETALSTIDALEISSDISETGSVCDEGYTLKSSDDEDSQTVHSNSDEQVTLKSHANVEEVLRYLYCETSLPTIKTLCDWLRVDQKLVAFSAESINGLFSQFAEMLNILKDVEIKALASNTKLERLKYTDPNWTQKYPLTSDMNLLKFKLLDKFQSSSLDIQKYNENMDAEEMGFLTLECIISFGHFLTNNMNKSQLSYDVATRSFKYDETTEMKTAKLPRNSSAMSNGVKNYSRKMESISQDDEFMTNGKSKWNFEGNEMNSSQGNDLSKQKQVMRNMAHLWLKSEVSFLEKAVRGKDSTLSPYVVIHVSAYLYQLTAVRDLMFSKRFFVVVPKIVLQDLDHYKKISPAAREAIRLIENEAQKGRFIKFLNDRDRSSLAPLKYPRRRDREAFDFFIFLEYCNYLNKQKSSVTNENRTNLPMVVALYGNNAKLPANADVLARSAGITMEKIDVFNSKWRNSRKTRT